MAWTNFNKRMCGKWMSEKFDVKKYNDNIIFMNIKFKDEEKKEVNVYFEYDNPECNHSAFHVEQRDNSLTPQALMEFADKNGGRTNCRGLALILSQLIRAYNIKAFHITCRPYEEPFQDCHVVVCSYCESLNKWIFLDPSSNLYLKNKDGEIISINEFRNILIEGGELIANEGSLALWDSIESYRDYMAKNLIRLDRSVISRYGCDHEGFIMLIPEKYMQNDAKNFNEETQKYFTTSEEDFWQI